MPPSKPDLAYLWDMAAAARTILRFIANRSFSDYQQDDMLRSAVERQVEIIGEAARFVSTSFKDTHPEIPWQKIIVQRHVLAHQYGEIDDNLIWKVATIHIPILVGKLEPLITPLPPEMD